MIDESTMRNLVGLLAPREQMVTRLMACCWRPEIQCYYFGCIERAGHFLHGTPPGGARIYDVENALSAVLGGIDAKLCWNSPRGRDLYAQRDETEGRAFLTHRGGWTTVAFWDRSVDHRGGCNSVFIVNGTVTYEQAVRVARHRWPHVWRRFTFEIVQVDYSGRRVG